MTVVCIKHPKYNGRRVPKGNCTGCLSVYLMSHQTPRVKHKPTKVETPKKFRKPKHKKPISEDD